MSENNVEVGFGASTGDLENGVANAAKSVTDSIGKMKEGFGSLGEVVEKLQGQFLGIGALLLGGLGFAHALNEAKNFNLESQKMSMLLGIQRDEAVALGTALEMVGSSSEQYTGILQRITMRLRSSEDSFNAMGVATRNANGEYLNAQEILQNSLKVLTEYKAGTDRNLASTTLLGRGWAEASKLLQLSKVDMEMLKEEQKALNLVVGDESVEASRQYRIEMVRAEEVSKAFGVVIGNTVMPTITHLLKLFADDGPTKVSIFTLAVRTLVSSFDGFIYALEIAWSHIKQFTDEGVTLFKQLVAGIQLALEDSKILAFFKALGKESLAWLKGDTQGMIDAWHEYDAKAADIAANGRRRELALTAKNSAEHIALDLKYFKEREEITKAALARQEAIWDPKSTQTKDKGTKQYVDPKEKDDKEDQAAYKAMDKRLSEAKRAYSLMNDMRKMSAADEAAFWERNIGIVTEGGATYSIIMKKVNELRLKQAEKEHKDEIGLLTESVKLRESMTEADLKIGESEAQRRFDLGQITKEQLLAIQLEFETRRRDMQIAFQQERIAIAERDPDNPVKIKQEKDKLLEIEAAFQQKKSGIVSQAELERRKYQLAADKSVESGLSSGISTILTKWQTLATSLKSIFQSIYQSLVKSLIADPLAELAMMFIKKTAMYTAFQSWYSGMLVAAGLTEAVARKATAVSEVPAIAAVAAGEAAGSVAGIPIAGPVLAATAYAETYAMIMAGLAGVASSAGGDWQIPSDRLNLVHAQETILPADKSKGLDDLISSGSSGAVHLHVHAVDAQSVQRLFMNNGDALAKALKAQSRNFSKALS